jgi:ribonuclease P protein component
MMRPPLQMERMKTRADFLRAQKGRRFNTAGIGLEMCASPEAAAKEDTLRVGFTASVKVGNAVARNRAKRRLREVARAILPFSGEPEHDYVLVARAVTVTRPYAALLDDLSKALAAIKRPEGKRNG